MSKTILIFLYKVFRYKDIRYKYTKLNIKDNYYKIFLYKDIIGQLGPCQVQTERVQYSQIINQEMV